MTIDMPCSSGRGDYSRVVPVRIDFFLAGDPAKFDKIGACLTHSQEASTFYHLSLSSSPAAPKLQRVEMEEGVVLGVQCSCWLY
jgi:hypothetical protein